MTKTNTITRYFQTSAFRLSDAETFHSLSCVNHIINVMKVHGLSHELDGDYIALSLPSSAFTTSDFDDISDKVTRDDLLNIVEAIESQIHPDDACKLVYVESKIGEYFDCFSSTIEHNNTVTSKVDCSQFNRIPRLSNDEVSS
jgi:hypothetical protein